ncbi:hypothetical protein V5F34_11660 [Xanthobacter autotrophicus]|uniref:hypothetical protein n=1 Tax=Xanthobacter autotrophicus TaxID=280 RepID=UPI003727123B
MATPSATIVCALVALFLWVPAGWLMARRLPLGADLRLAAAPILGWAAQGVVALQVSMSAGFSAATILAVTVLVGIAAFLAPPSAAAEPSAARPLPLWALLAATLVAMGPALAVVPKVVPEGVALAAPIYDHAKVALVDEMVRSGVPPANPFLGGGSEPGTIAYYYFWLFGAAQLALVSGASGWEADIAATWFTGFATLALMGGLAFRLSGGREASIAFVLVAALGSALRPVLSALFGRERLDAALEPATGLGGWLFQASWSPHHVAAGATVVLAIILMEHLARRPAAAPVLALAALAAAGFESSLWVGGVTFALCAGAAGLVLLVRAEPAWRLPFLTAVAVAAGIALALVLPLLLEQLRSAAGRGDAMPILVSPYPVLGPAVPESVRRLLDLPAYWLVLLPIEFPVAMLLGAPAALRLGSGLASPLPLAALASLCAGGLLVSTVGENNDLGWRAILPGVMILTAYAAAGFALSLDRRRRAGITVGILLLCLALPDGLGLLKGNATGKVSADAARFRDAPALWAAVRRHTAPDERIASNPHLTNGLVPWPISLSWALLADRRSCFAGNELALAFTALAPPERAAASALFDRVFAGTASDADLAVLVRDFRCRVIVLTPEEGAFSHDPFAARHGFRLMEQTDGKWRIYRADP